MNLNPIIWASEGFMLVAWTGYLFFHYSAHHYHQMFFTPPAPDIWKRVPTHTELADCELCGTKKKYTPYQPVFLPGGRYVEEGGRVHNIHCPCSRCVAWYTDRPNLLSEAAMALTPSISEAASLSGAFDGVAGSTRQWQSTNQILLQPGINRQHFKLKDLKVETPDGPIIWKNVGPPCPKCSLLMVPMKGGAVTPDNFPVEPGEDWYCRKCSEGWPGTCFKPDGTLK